MNLVELAGAQTRLLEGKKRRKKGNQTKNTTIRNTENRRPGHTCCRKGSGQPVHGRGVKEEEGRGRVPRKRENGGRLHMGDKRETKEPSQCLEKALGRRRQERDLRLRLGETDFGDKTGAKKWSNLALLSWLLTGGV
jgi:hypothetical protein